MIDWGQGMWKSDITFNGEMIWLPCVDRYTRFLRMKVMPEQSQRPIAQEVYAWLGSGKIRSIATDRSLKWSVLNPWLVDLLKSGLVSMLLSRTAVGKRERSRT